MLGGDGKTFSAATTPNEDGKERSGLEDARKAGECSRLITGNSTKRQVKQRDCKSGNTQYVEEEKRILLPDSGKGENAENRRERRCRR